MRICVYLKILKGDVALEGKVTPDVGAHELLVLESHSQSCGVVLSHEISSSCVCNHMIWNTRI